MDNSIVEISLLEILLSEDSIRRMNVLENKFLSEEDILEEGSNMDMTKAFYEGKKKFKEEYKKFKTSCKDHRFDDARDNIGNMSVILNDMEKAIKDIPQDKTSIVIGDIINALLILWGIALEMLKNMLVNKISGAIYTAITGKKLVKGPSLPHKLLYGKDKKLDAIFDFFEKDSTIKAINIIKKVIKIISIYMKQIKHMKTEYEKAETEEEKAKCANMYRDKLITSIEDLKATLNDYIQLCNMREEWWKKKQERKNKKKTAEE